MTELWRLSGDELLARFPTVDAILAIPDQLGLICALRAHVARDVRGRAEEALTEEARTIAHAESVLSVALSGGLSNVVPWNSTARVALYVRALRRIGADSTAAIVADALDLALAVEAKGDTDHLRTVGDWCAAMGASRFETLSTAFDAVATDEVDGQIQEYLWIQRESFRPT